MKVYKFKDTVDGRLAYVLANDLEEALHKINTVTTISCKLVDSKHASELSPILIRNNILPF